MAAGNDPETKENLGKDRKLSDYRMLYFDLETTGLGNRAEICQIGACYGEKEFSRYVCPKRDFDSGASEATGFAKVDGALHLRGERVDTVPILEAWIDFLEFLRVAKTSVVLVIHNRPFDSRFILRDLAHFRLMEEFRKLCAGMIDTLPLCREVFPDRKKQGKNYKLEELVRDLVGEGDCTGSHNALVDVKNLEKLMKVSNIQPQIFEKFYLPVSDLEYSYNVRRKANFLTYKIPNLTSDTAKKITEAEITYEDLKNAFSKDGEAGIKSLLSPNKEDGKPKVISREKIIKDISETLSRLKISVENP